MLDFYLDVVGLDGQWLDGLLEGLFQYGDALFLAAFSDLKILDLDLGYVEGTEW